MKRTKIIFKWLFRTTALLGAVAFDVHMFRTVPIDDSLLVCGLTVYSMVSIALDWLK